MVDRLQTDGTWPDTIRILIDELNAADVEELELTVPGARLRILRAPGRRWNSGASNVEAAEQQGPTVDAPLGGVFYRAVSPTSDPYAREGDVVEPGQVIGLIEAMKVFNEIHSDQAGTIKRFLATNGQLVQTGAPLVELEVSE